MRSTHTDVWYAPIDASSGKLGNWTATTSLPAGRQTPNDGLVYNSYLYVVGGYCGCGCYANDVWSAALQTDGTIAAWHSNAPLPTVIRAGAGGGAGGAVAVDGFMYFLPSDARGNGFPSTLVSAAINPMDGTISAWNSVTAALTPGRGAYSALAYNHNLYVFGGTDSAGNEVPRVDTAVSMSGQTSDWSTWNQLLTGRQFGGAATINGYLYYLGGMTSQPSQHTITDVVRIPVP